MSSSDAIAAFNPLVRIVWLLAYAPALLGLCTGYFPVAAYAIAYIFCTAGGAVSLYAAQWFILRTETPISFESIFAAVCVFVHVQSGFWTAPAAQTPSPRT